MDAMKRLKSISRLNDAWVTPSLVPAFTSYERWLREGKKKTSRLLTRLTQATPTSAQREKERQKKKKKKRAAEAGALKAERHRNAALPDKLTFRDASLKDKSRQEVSTPINGIFLFSSFLSRASR